MYLMIDKHLSTVSKYFHFLNKRFFRIAPAFFASVIVYAAIIKTQHPAFQFWYNVFFHFLFLNNVVTGNTISGPFWSIGVEWHFYMILPLVLLLGKKITMLNAVFLLSIISLSFFFFINTNQLNVLWWENQILTRFPEFGCGIIAAICYLGGRKIPGFLMGLPGLLVGFIVMYLGRLMMFTPFLLNAGNLGFISKTLSYTIMTAGFGFIMYHVITLPSMLSRILSTRVLTYLGRISYSIYLWHSLAFIILWPFLTRLNFGSWTPLFVFAAVGMLTVFIAHFSYKLLESFYFKRPVVYATR